MKNKPLEFDYRDRLSNEFLARRRRNPSYSLRALARDLALSPATVSQVLSGKRDLSRKNALNVAERLAFSPAQVQQMLNDIRGSRDVADWSDHHLLQDDTFRVMSDWYYFAILNLARIPSSRPDPEWIAERIGIGQVEAREALERLQRLGLLEITRGRLKRTHGSLTTTDGVPSGALRNFHKQNLERARASIDQDPVGLRDVSSLTMAVDPAQMEDVRRALARFKKRFTKAFASATPREVYTLAIQFFPQTRKGISS